MGSISSIFFSSESKTRRARGCKWNYGKGVWGWINSEKVDIAHSWKTSILYSLTEVIVVIVVVVGGVVAVIK